jgi:hypothetical protein
MRVVRETDELLFLRYLKILSRASEWSGPEGTNKEHLIWMANESINHITEWPIDKLNRWLGFIQGVLAMQGLVSIVGEREFSRPLFHQAYVQDGVLIPNTLEAPANIQKPTKIKKVS